MQWVNQQMTAQVQWHTSPPLTQNDVIDRIERWLNAQRVLFASIYLEFGWNGFRKAGTNTFSDRCTLQFVFDKFQYSVTAMHGSGAIFQFSDVYQNPLTEAQIVKIVNGLAEACFIHIEKQVRHKQ